MTALALTPNGVKRPMLSNVFEEWFGNDLLNNGNYILPKTNVIENDDNFMIELSVPGYQKKDFEIKVDKRVLIVTNSIEETDKGSSDNYIVREFTKKTFSKSFKLANTIDSENISAKCTNGILSITLPKIEEAKSKPPRTIEIK